MAQVKHAITDKMVTVRIGDSIGFKDDVEQYGTVDKINGEWIYILVLDGRTGGQSIVQQHESACWVGG